MTTTNQNRVIFGCLGLATAALTIWGGSMAYERVRDREVTIATGDSNSESYILAQGIKTVVERRHPFLRVKLLETGGTAESLALLNSGKAQFAMARADVIAGAHARGEARLYEEVFQIVVPADSPIRTIDDLKGKRIALSRRGEQFQSFLYLVRRRGLGESDFHFVGDDSDGPGAAFARGQADAYFAVRPLHNDALSRITQNLAVRFLSIDDTTALRLDVPAYRSSVILKASYQGNPPVPDSDVQTAAVDRLLLVHEDVPNYVAYAFAEVLSEDRQEIAQALTDASDWVRELTVSIRPPETNTGLAATVHPGAELYYSNRKLSLSIGEIMMGIALVGILAALWLLAFRNLKRQRQKHFSDAFNSKMMQLVEEALSGVASRPLEEIRHDSLKLLSQAVGDLDAGNMSGHTFQSSRAVWQIAYDLMRENASVPGKAVRTGTSPEPQGAPPPPAAPPLLPEFRTAIASSGEERSGKPKGKPWSMWRDG